MNFNVRRSSSPRPTVISVANPNSVPMSTKPSPLLIQPSDDSADILFAKALQSAIARERENIYFWLTYSEARKTAYPTARDSRTCHLSE